ncbi:glycosyl transferase family 64 domain-containing protein, partial [Hyaloraphidium curvatum]
YGLGRRLLANGYSIVLTKAAFLHADYLWLASCALPHSVTTIVGEEGGCEDIAAAFLASGTSGKPPLLVHPGSGTVQCGERVPHELGSGDSAVARGEGWACWRAHAIEDYGYHSGLSGRAKHAPGRSRCLAAFEGIFGDVLKVSTEAVTGHGGWPPFLGRRDAGDLANSALLRG